MKVVLQDGIKDCGICSLLSIIRYYGGDVSKEYLREITNTTKDGVTAYGLIEGAKTIGFDAYGVSGDLTNIENNNLPCLGHILVNKNYKHFVAIYKIDKKNNKVYTMDPSRGKRVFSILEYKLVSTNNYIYLKPIKKLPIILNNKIIYREIIKFIKERKILIIVMGGLTLIYFILNILVSFHLKYLLEFGVNYSVNDNIIIISCFIMNLYLFKNIFSLLRNILLDKWLFILDNLLTTKLVKHIFYLPYLFYKNRTTGEVITKFRDFNIIKNYISKFIIVMSTDLFSYFIFMYLLFSINKTLSIIILIYSVIYVTFLIIRNKKKIKLIKNNYYREEKCNSYLIEGLSNVDTVKGSHLEKYLSDKFMLIYNKFLNSNYKYNRFLFSNSFIRNVIYNTLIVIIYGYLCYLVIIGSISSYNLYLFYIFMNYYLDSLNNIIEIILSYSDFLVALYRVEDLFSIRSENFNYSYFYLGYSLKGDICFKDFSYFIGTRCLFNKLNLNIKYKDKVLLSGASGSGKSTLMKILLRYINVNYNYISINNIDINHYHLESIRKNIIYITNNEYLFLDSIYNNIVLNNNISEDKFNEIVRICSLDFIDNFNKMVEDNGSNFSNGERQRIILARSLVRCGNIYILDEALSQVDIKLERRILKNLFNYLKDKTVIVISHRFYNNNLFNRNIILKDGVVYEKK